MTRLNGTVAYLKICKSLSVVVFALLNVEIFIESKNQNKRRRFACNRKLVIEGRVKKSYHSLP